MSNISKKALQEARKAGESVEQILDESFDKGALNTNIEQKLANLEQQYEPRLTGIDEKVDANYNEVSSQLAKTYENLNQREVNISQPPFNVSTTNVEYEKIQEAIDYCIENKFTLLVPSGDYITDKDETLVIDGALILKGSGKTSTRFLDNGVRSSVKLLISGNNVTIENMQFDLTQTLLSNRPAIEIEKGNNILISNNLFVGGHTAVWVDPLTNEKVENLKIINNEFKNFNHNIYLGAIREHEGFIDGVIIDGNHIHSGVQIDGGGDGVKTIKKVKNVIITNNIIEEVSRDALDLFASGENILVANNVMRYNRVSGIDIKSDETNYPSIEYGKNGENIIIRGNLIYGNNTGLTVSQNLEHGDSNYYINITDNIIFNNSRRGARISGKHINFRGNFLTDNCKNVDSTHTLEIGRPSVETDTDNIIVENNQIVNNGFEDNNNYALYVNNRVEDSLITNNVIKNVSGNYGGLYINALTNSIVVKDNLIRGHTRDIQIISGAGVIAEKVTATFDEITQGFSRKDNILSYDKLNKYIVNCSVMLTETIPQDRESYVSINLRKRNADKENIFVGATPSSSNSAMEAYEEIPITISNQNKIILDSDIIFIRFDGVNGGKTIKNPFVKLVYIQH